MEQLAANSNCGLVFVSGKGTHPAPVCTAPACAFTCLRLRFRLGLGLGTSLPRVPTQPAPPRRAGPDLGHPLQEPCLGETHVQQNLSRTGRGVPGCSCPHRQGRGDCCLPDSPTPILLVTHRQALKSPFFCFPTSHQDACTAPRVMESSSTARQPIHAGRCP